MYLGDYSNPTWVNDSTKLNATNMQAITNKIKEVDDELNASRSYNYHWLRAYLYLKNQKVIDYGSTGWTIEVGTSTTVSNDTTNFRMLTQSIRSTYGSASAGWTWINKTVTLNLTKSPSDDDLSGYDHYIIALIYISNASAVNTIQLWLQSASVDAYYAKTTGFSTGWNYIYIPKSSFVNYTTLVWDSIVKISYRVNFNAGYSGAYTSLQYYGLCRKHPTNSVPELFQTYNGSSWNALNTDFSNYVGALVLDGTGDSFPNPNLCFFLSSIDVFAMKFGSEYWKNFYFKAYFRLKKAGKSPGICWYVDASNYIHFYLDGSNVNVISRVSGTSTSYGYALGSTPAIDTTLLMSASKVGGVVRCIFWLTAYSTIIVECADALPNTYGRFYLSYPASDSFGYLRDFVVSNRPNISLTSGNSLF